MRKPARIALIVIAALAGLVAVVTLIGFALPREHTAVSEITLRQPIDSVYAVLRDIGGVTTWWKDVTASERVSGAPGERWKQEASGMTMQLDVVSDSPPRGFVTRVVEDDGMPFGGIWTYSLVALPSGTTIRVTERGWIGPAPFRVMARVMGVHGTIDAMLTALGARFGEDVKPAHR